MRSFKIAVIISEILLMLISYNKIVLGYNLSPIQEKDVPVFQPFPSLNYDTRKLCQDGLSSSIVPFSLNSKSYVAVSMSICGIFIYDISDLDNPNLVFNHILNPNGKTTAISYSKNTQYLWIGHSSGSFYGMNLNKMPFQVSVIGVSNNNLLINKVIPWPLNNNILFLACQKQFQIFDYRDGQNEIKYLQGIATNAINVFQIEFVRQYSVALVAASNKGIQFYTVKDGKDIDTITFTYTCVLKPIFFDVRQFVLVEENKIAIMIQYTGVFLYDIQPFLDDPNYLCNQNSFIKLSQTPFQGMGCALHISNNSHYLYAQFRAIGVRLYDLVNHTFQIVQNIRVDADCQDLTLNEEENLLFYTNSLSFQIFKKTTPNFNRDKPNLLLNSYQIVQYNSFKESLELGSLDYECVFKEDKNALYLARSNYGVATFRYSGSGILESLDFLYRDSSLPATSKISFLADGNIAYVCRTILGLYIINFEDPSNPKIIKEGLRLQSPFVYFNFIEVYKNYQLGILGNGINAYIVSLADPLNPMIIGMLDTMKQTGGETTLMRCRLTKDGNSAYLIVFTYGILVADISNPLSPKFTSKLSTNGVFEFRLTMDEKYAIIGNTYKGIFIALVGTDYSLTIISQVVIFGSIFSLILMYNDEYVIVTTHELPSISLVSIVDRYNPQVVQRIGQSSAYGYYSLCLSKDQSSIFVTSQYSLLLLQLQNQIVLHTQIYELISKENSNEYTKIILEKDVSLSIGQKIEMHLVPIYQTQDIIVRKAFYYEGYVLQELPPWMVFYPGDSILSLNISKDSLKKNDAGNYIETIQQVVFLTYQSVNKDVFVNTYLNILPADSLAIVSACQSEGYIDSLGFIQESYTPTKEINFGVNENVYLQKWIGPKLKLVKNFIQYTLNQNIINYTISFKIAQSISVNLQNQNEHIISLQDTITLSMIVLELLPDKTTVQSSKAKFVKKNYSGVLVLLTELQDEIKLEGSLKNINKILTNGIKFSFKENIISANNIQIKIIVSDGVNYNYENTVNFTDLIFLSMQAPIVISPELTLQDDFNSKYTDGKIFIQDSFQYQVGAAVFTSVDEKQLSYSAKLQNDEDKFVDLPKDYWMQFSLTDRVFTGTPPASYFNQKIIIQVNATDGYSFTVDTFEVIPNRIPFSYAFQFAIQVLGPIFGILGLYKYKHFMYNVMFKQQYVYTKDVAYVGEEYKKQITITDNNTKIARRLWSFFINRIGEVQVMHQLQAELMKEKQTTSFLFYNPELMKTEQENNNVNQNLSSFEEEVIKKMYPFGVQNEQFGIVDRKFKRILTQSFLNVSNENNNNNSNNHNNNNNNNNNINQQRKSLSKSNQSNLDANSQIILETHDKESTQNAYQKDLLRSRTITTSYNRQRKSTVRNINERKIIDNIKHGVNIWGNIQRSKTLNDQSPNINKSANVILLLFNDDGKINFKGIIKYIKEEQQFLPEKNRIITHNELKNLENINSVLSQSICCLLVDHLMNCDRITKNLFDYLYHKAIKYYNEIDWYKAYLDIEPQFENIHTNPYPLMTINKKTTHTALREIFESLSHYYYDPIKKSPKQIKFSLELLEQCIKCRGIGVTLKSIPLLQVTQGESLHTFSHTIHSVKAFQRNSEIACCLTLHKKLDLHYIEESLTDNKRLPSWIQSLDLINGAILISGVPEKKDIGSILIKVIDKQEFILRSYQIQVLQKEIPINHEIQKNTNNNQIISILNDQELQNQNYQVMQKMNNQNVKPNINLSYQKKRSMFATETKEDVFIQQFKSNLLYSQIGRQKKKQSMVQNDKQNQIDDVSLNEDISIGIPRSQVNNMFNYLHNQNNNHNINDNENNNNNNNYQQYETQDSNNNTHFKTDINYSESSFSSQIPFQEDINQQRYQQLLQQQEQSQTIWTSQSDDSDSQINLEDNFNPSHQSYIQNLQQILQDSLKQDYILENLENN